MWNVAEFLATPLFLVLMNFWGVYMPFIKDRSSLCLWLITWVFLPLGMVTATCTSPIWVHYWSTHKTCCFIYSHEIRRLVNCKSSSLSLLVQVSLTTQSQCCIIEFHLLSLDGVHKYIVSSSQKDRVSQDFGAWGTYRLAPAPLLFWILLEDAVPY